MVAACRAFRGWSLAHRAEFGLLFEHTLAKLAGLLGLEYPPAASNGWARRRAVSQGAPPS
jgi:uncharacterized protein YfiM (DUF2279 family)